MEQLTATKTMVAIYTRVSSAEQAENGYSIDEQERILVKYCHDNDYTIFKCYSDKGISGKDIKGRPAMRELLNDAKEGKFSMVISWKLNRISRSLKDIIEINDILEKNGIQYRSITESFETQTPAGKMLFQMLGAVGELERNTIAENVKMGMCARAREGKYCCGIAPYGYDINRAYQGKRGDCYLTVNESEAEVVRLIFSMHNKGWGYKKIVNHINERGYRTKKGNLFAVSTVRDLLLNPVYAGYLRYNVRQNWTTKRRAGINPNPIIVKGVHEAIISEETWEKSKIQMKTKQKTTKRHNGFYPLTGILRCPQCGSGMVLAGSTQGDKRITYYCCSAWHSKGKIACKANMIRTDKANDIVLGKLAELLNNEKMISKMLERHEEHTKSEQNPLKEQLTSITKEREKLTKAVDKLFELYEFEVIGREEFFERKQALDEKIKQVQTNLDNVQVQYCENDLTISEENLHLILKRFKDILLEAEDQDEVKNLLHLLIKKITIGEDRNIDSIVLHINDDLIKFIYPNVEEIPDGISSFLFEPWALDMVI